MARLTIDYSTNSLDLFADSSETFNVQRIPQYRYDFKKKCWTFVLSAEKVKQIRLVFANRVMVEQPVLDWIADEIRKEGLLKIFSEVDYVKLPKEHKPKLKLFKHQETGVNFILGFKKALLLDEMGLGKSAQALVAFSIAKNKGEVHRCLIVCPKSLLYNWSVEVEKHTNFKCRIIYGSKGKRGKLIQDSKEFIWIASFDTIRLHREEGWFKNFAEGEFLIIDEATYIKNTRAERTKAIFDIPSRYKVLLTGTPIMNKPDDCYSLIQSVKPTWKSWWSFEDAYITKKISRSPSGKVYASSITYKNLEDLKEKLNKVSLRRLKCDCLDLPEKVFEDRLIDMTDEQQKKYDICLNELRLEFTACKDEEYYKKQISFFAQITRLNQISDGFISDGKRMEFIENAGKFKELDTIVKDLGKEKVVVWSWFVGLIKYLHTKYAGKSVMLIGDMNEKERSVAIEKFKTDPDCQLFIGQVRTGGMGLNLTEAQTQIFFDIPMTPGEYLQAIDRLHRIGTKGTVNIINFLSNGSIDLKFKKSLVRKMDLISKVTGEKLAWGKEELKDILNANDKK